MADIFLKIINMSISATWIVLTVLLLRLLLKKAPKWITVLLWGVVAVRLICPFSIESIMSLVPSTEIISPEIMVDKTPTIDSGVPIINNIVNPVVGETFAPDPTASANPLQILIPVLAIVWIVGIAAMLIYILISFLRLKRKIITAVLLRDNIYQSESVVSPFVLGIIKPKIYLPFNINDQCMEHVIAHEQAHIRRKDYLWKPLGFLILTLHWFNPMVWLGYILLCRDIELACDEKVIKRLNNDQRADYSQALLTCSVNRRMIVACPLAFGEVGVKDRVKSVLNYKKPAFWIIIVAIVASIVIAICFLTDPLESNDDKTTNSTSNNTTTSDILSTNADTVQCTHVWGQWVEKTKASCQTTGMKERICHNCHITESQKTEKLAHKESDWIIEKVADIGKDGVKYTKCVHCNKEMNKKTIPAITENHEHKVTEWLIVKNPDCTNKGIQNAVCSCGKTIETKEIASKGHTTVIDKAVAATCTSNGLTEGSHCSVCNNIIIQQKTTDKLPHKSIIDIAVAATCTSEGLTQGSHCSVCNTVIVKQNSINKLPHVPVTDAAVSATCKDTGMSEGSHCSVCKMVLVEQTVIPKTNTHTLSSWIIETEATCKAVGKKYRKCIDCNKKLETATIEKLTTHRVGVMNVEIDDGLFCGDKGEYFSTVYCKDCGEKISEGNHALPEKHSMKNGVCEICGLPQSTTAGLRFILNPDKKSYYVTANRNTFLGGNVVIGVYNGLSVTEVGPFDLCEGLKSIVIGDCVKKIEVFCGCTNLKNVVIGNGVKEIPEEAFSDCTSLTTVTIGDNVEKIGEKAFYKCNKLYYAYISGAHDWKCNNLYNNNVTIYGSWIGKEYGMESYFADYLKEYTTYEWTRK